MAKLKGLGRGLDALLGNDNARAAPGDALAMLAIDVLQPGRFQPRLSHGSRRRSPSWPTPSRRKA